jgi:sugar lactone lactonase YvrE
VALRPERLSLPPGFTYPNGITHAEDGTLFVGSVSSGRILRRAPGGDWTELFPGSEEVFAVTSLRLDAPRGLLWGTSPDAMGLLRPDGTLGKRAHRLFAVDARTGEVRQIVPIPEGGMGNDLTVAPDGGLYVTDSNRGSVLHLRPGGKQLETYVADARLQAKGTGMASVGPAGIALAPAGRTLAVNTYGPGRLFLVRAGPEMGCASRGTAGCWCWKARRAVGMGAWCASTCSGRRPGPGPSRCSPPECNPPSTSP